MCGVISHQHQSNNGRIFSLQKKDRLLPQQQLLTGLRTTSLSEGCTLANSLALSSKVGNQPQTRILIEETKAYSSSSSDFLFIIPSVLKIKIVLKRDCFTGIS